MELLLIIACAAVCAVQILLSIGLWCETRAFRQYNEALGQLMLEIEQQQKQFMAGFLGAVRDRALADEAKEDRARAH